MKLQHHIKNGVRLAVEADGNPITLVIRMSKGQLFKLLDYLIPDPEPDT